MKATVDHAANMLQLDVETTGGDKKKTVYFSPENVHFWYPFNTNFSYRYSTAKGVLYLVAERGHTGENVYGADILKRSKSMVVNKDGFLVHPEVHKRNMYITELASSMGIPTVVDHYTSHDVVEGFNILNEEIQQLRDTIETRFMNKDEAYWTITQTELNEDWDIRLYSHATKEELDQLQEFGEIYNMLCLMRKLAEGR